MEDNIANTSSLFTTKDRDTNKNYVNFVNKNTGIIVQFPKETAKYPKATNKDQSLSIKCLENFSGLLTDCHQNW